MSSALNIKTIFMGPNTGLDEEVLILDPKYAAEVLNYAVDASALLLQTADQLLHFNFEITQSLLEANDLSLSFDSVQPSFPLVFQVSGGSSQNQYSILFTLTTTQGNIWNTTITLQVK